MNHLVEVLPSQFVKSALALVGGFVISSGLDLSFYDDTGTILLDQHHCQVSALCSLPGDQGWFSPDSTQTATFCLWAYATEFGEKETITSCTESETSPNSLGGCILPFAVFFFRPPQIPFE
jgi:hypothetical protein